MKPANGLRYGRLCVAVVVVASALIGCGGSDPVALEEPTPTPSSVASSDRAAASSNRAAALLEAQAATTAWSNEPGGVSVAVDAADNVYTVLWEYNPGGDIYLYKRNASGALQWTARHDNKDATRHEVATWVGTDSGGNVLVSGTIRSGYSNPVDANSVLMKFGPDGGLLWRQVYGTDFDGSSTRKLIVDAAGNIYVLGLGRSSAGQRTTVRKFAANGDTVWSWFDPVGIGAPLNFKWAGDGNLVIAARSIFGSFNGFAKIDTSGQTLWTMPSLASLTAGDIAGDAAGNSYLITGSFAAGAASAVRKLDPAGNFVWERTQTMAGLRIEVGTDSHPVVSGLPNASTAGVAFSKFDANGTHLWTNLDADGQFTLLAHAQMVLDSAGSAYLAASDLSQMGVVKVASNGGSAWTVLIPFGTARGLALGQSGRVFVTGGTTARIDQTTGEPPPPPAVANLGVTLTDSPDPVARRSTLVLTARVTNEGPASATQVRLSETLPAGVTLVSIVPSQGSCSGSGTITCSLGTLAANGSATVTVTVLVTRKGSGSLTTTASVAAAETDPVTANNVASATTLLLSGRGGKGE